MAQCARFAVLVLACKFLISLSSAKSDKIKESYVVYMGSPSGSDPDAVQSAHLQMLSSIFPSAEQQRISLTRSYHHAFEGFSAMLTEEEAAQLSGHERVVSVFRDHVLQLHTTRSWNFLQEESGLQPDRLIRQATGRVIAGIVDTGLWPESPSFAPIGKSEQVFATGDCAPDFPCSDKVPNAKYYVNDISGDEVDALTSGGSPRDRVGHGTHTASAGAGDSVMNAGYYGLGPGTATGGLASTRIGVYKACNQDGCPSSAVLEAIDDAVRDGMDIISLSMGAAPHHPDLLSDPIAIGAFHAIQHGVIVVCSAGNDGPGQSSIVNTAPWILTVAASSIDRGFQSDIVLGNGIVVKGVAINFSNQSLSGGQYPLVLGPQVAAQSATASQASNCSPGSLDAQKAAGKIVVCVATDTAVLRRTKVQIAEGVGAKGLVLIDDAEIDTALDSGVFPFSQVRTNDGAQINQYMSSTKNPTAVILPSQTVSKVQPAPVVASFSARGPSELTESILKPDLMAPGISIVGAAIPPKDMATVPAGKTPSNFTIMSGTSMSCAHVTGAAALVKSAHPDFSPSMIRSALMTTATTTNNVGQPLTTFSGTMANSHDMGAGEMIPLRALSPGLVFETTTEDYLKFLCYHGYKEELIRKISGTTFACSVAPSPDLIAANVNYPSISIPRLFPGKGVTVTRTATNVGPVNATYVASIDAPAGLSVHVWPETLVFAGSRWRKASYQVSFGATGASKGYNYGSISWSDGKHSVRMVFVVNVM